MTIKQTVLNVVQTAACAYLIPVAVFGAVVTVCACINWLDVTLPYTANDLPAELVADMQAHLDARESGVLTADEAAQLEDWQ